jgi:DUF917 family protein
MSRVKNFFTRNMMERLVEGAAFLGSGGGGKIDSGKKFIDIVLQGKPVELLKTPLTPAQGRLMSCIACDIGAISEFDPNQDKALVYAFEALQQYFFNDKRPIKTIFPIETGAENSMAAIALASKFGLSVIDADGAGRAVPILPLSTFSVLGTLKNPSPVAIASGKGDVLLVGRETPSGYEALLRPIAALKEFGSSASLVLWPDKAGSLVKSGINGTISRAIACGELFRAIREDDEKKIKRCEAPVNKLQGMLLAAGRVDFVESEQEDAFNFGAVKIINQLRKETITVLSQNESLIAYSDQQDGPIAIAPHAICFLDSDMNPLTNSEIAKEDKVYLIAVQANKKMMSPKIKAGFEDIMKDLGYFGKLDFSTRGFTKLGSLISKLKQIPVR